LIIAGANLDIHLEKQEILSLYLHLTNNYDKLDSALQDVARKIENHVYSTFTISEIAEINENDKGEP